MAIRDEYLLKFNPFQPAASGLPLIVDPWLPKSWETALDNHLLHFSQSNGPRVLPIIGAYGSGKSYVLQWLARYRLPDLGIQPYYFDNPGLRFYDLANNLLRFVGRREFAKIIWELARAFIEPKQLTLFEPSFDEYIAMSSSPQRRTKSLELMEQGILKAGITADEEIANRLARIPVDLAKKPFFEYRDFVPSSTALVAERQEVAYFRAILEVLTRAYGLRAVAFLIDEFEEISLGRTMSSRDAQDYFTTMKRLVNAAEEFDLWIFLSMTEDAYQKTRQMNEALVERFGESEQAGFRIPPLTPKDGAELTRVRLRAARKDAGKVPHDLWPFPENFPEGLSPAIQSKPRLLVQLAFHAIAESGEPPFDQNYLGQVSKRVPV